MTSAACRSPDTDRVPLAAAAHALWPQGYAADYFVVEVEGFIEFAVGGFYTFFLSGGDEVRTWSHHTS